MSYFLAPVDSLRVVAFNYYPFLFNIDCLHPENRASKKESATVSNFFFRFLISMIQPLSVVDLPTCVSSEMSVRLSNLLTGRILNFWYVSPFTFMALILSNGIHEVYFLSAASHGKYAIV